MLFRSMIICKKHGPFMMSPAHHLGNEGCPTCKSSRGARYIEKVLKDEQVHYKKEYSFNDLKGDRGKLRFDFALFEGDELTSLVEFDGVQHFERSSHFHRSEDAFKKLKRYDRLKNKYCKTNNIKLYRIAYNENIETALLEILDKERRANEIL